MYYNTALIIIIINLFTNIYAQNDIHESRNNYREISKLVYIDKESFNDVILYIFQAQDSSYTHCIAPKIEIDSNFKFTNFEVLEYGKKYKLNLIRFENNVVLDKSDFISRFDSITYFENKVFIYNDICRVELYYCTNLFLMYYLPHE
jgi:hypothetical protein